MFKKIDQYLHKEVSISKPDFSKPLSVGLAYPDSYQNGVANLAISTLYRLINSRNDAYATRVYVPDQETKDELLEHGIPYFTWEDKKPLRDHGILAFSFSFEELYPHLLEILELGKIPVFSKDRTDGFPLIIGGGPTVSYNPEPIADFIDAFVIGDGEEIISDIIDVYNSILGVSKETLLKGLAKLDGLYVPSFYKVSYDGPRIFSRTSPDDVRRVIKKRFYRDVGKNPARSNFITDQSIYRESNFSIEFARGCVYMCNFCQYSHNSKKPRFLDVETAIDLIKKEGIGNASAIRIFYEALPKGKLDRLFEGLEYLIDEHKIKLRIGAFTSSQLTDDVVRIAAKGGQKCITVAPETFDGELRVKLGGGKRFGDERIFEVVRLASKYHIPDLGLYLMIGLPRERFDDIIPIGNLIIKVREFMYSCGNKDGVLEVHLNPFFPKPLTPFQWAGIESLENSSKKLRIVEDMLSQKYKVGVDNKGVYTVGTGHLGEEDKVNGYNIIIKTFVGTKMQFSQPILSRGDRRVGNVLYYAYKHGNSLEAWQEALREEGIDPAFYLEEKDVDDVLP